MHAICTFVFTLFLPLRHCSWLMETIFKKVRTENILKIYKHLVLPTFLYGSENWTLTALQRRGIEAAEVKLLRPLAGYTLYDHKTNDYIRCKLRITGIIDKIDEYRRNWLSHLQRMPQNRIPLKSYHYRPQGPGTRASSSGSSPEQRNTISTHYSKYHSPRCIQVNRIRLCGVK